MNWFVEIASLPDQGSYEDDVARISNRCFPCRLVPDGNLHNEAEALDPSDPAHASKLRELRQGESFLEYLIEL